jgi:hypothetical protein
MGLFEIAGPSFTQAANLDRRQPFELPTAGRRLELSSLAWTWRGSSLKWLAKLWYRSENTPLGGKSDGYATGMITYVLEQYGLPRENAHLQRALDWLGRNQSKSDGRWPGYSLNHPREQSLTGLFMSDAASAYAILALTASDPH